MTIQFPHMPEQVTRSEAEIIDYISNNPREFLQDSIGAVSQRLGVSGTTLSRFARRVGCGDYKGLKRLVSQQEQPVGPAAKLLETQQGFTVENWMLRQQLCLEKTLEGLDPQVFAQAAQALLDCHRVFIHAKSASASLGQLLLFRLRRLGIEAILLPSGGSEVLEGLSQARSDDLVVLFSFSKVSREGRMILEYQKQAGYRTLAFTSRSYLPEPDRADMNLFVYRGEAKEYHSMTAPAALIDALVVAVSEKLGDEAVQRLSNLHRLKKAYDADR